MNAYLTKNTKVSRVGINVYIQLKQFFLLSTKSVASTVYKKTAHLKTNQNREDNVRDNKNLPVFFIWHVFDIIKETKHHS